MFLVARAVMSDKSAEKSIPVSTPSSNFRTPVVRIRRLGLQTSGGSPALFSRTPRTPGAPVTPRVVQVNDDEAERRELRLQKNRAPMSPGCHTPQMTAGSSSVHRDTRLHTVESSSSSLTNTQLAEHYSNCMKLSSQNKISAKNAFGLHLIDHMLKLLKMRGEMSNFQIASSTLDASTKIYAGRVDSIYNDIFKVLGGMGKEHLAALSKEVNKGGEEGEEGGETDGKKSGRKSKKTGSGTGLMLEDPKKLNVADFDYESRVDPLFQKTAAAFDEGGPGGLLMNNLFVQDDGCSLTLDASQMPITTDQPSEEGITVHIEEDLFDVNSIQNRLICPTFANFKFDCVGVSQEGNWDMTRVQCSEVGGEGRSGGGMGQDADFTMLDCPPPTAATDDLGADEEDDGFGDAPAMDADVDQGFNSATQGNTTVLGVCRDNQMAQFVSAPGVESEQTGSQESGVGNLCLTDLINPTDYTFFNPAVIASWAGPQHWKILPRNAPKKPAEKESKPKKRKSLFKVDFTKTPAKSLFATSKASTQLSKAAVSKLDSSQTTLPRDVHNDVDVLHSLFSQPEWKIRRQKKAGVVDEDIEGDWYDYDNANDQLNYCPPVDNGGDSDDAMDETAPGFYCTSQGAPSGTALPPGVTTAEEEGEGNEELEGENLVAQPRKVDHIRVDYARRAKKVDVKKLKTKMWDVISRPQEAEKGEEQVDSSDKGAACVEFSSMYSELPTFVSAGMAKNLSVPICFVCLLHLANEKELRLEPKTDLSDFDIFTTES